jgi:hypothetical protein
LGGFSIIWFFYGAGRLFAAEFSGFPDVSELPVRVEMPSPLVTEDGRQIQSVTEWSARRQEMKRVLEHYAIGHQGPARSMNSLGCRTISACTFGRENTCLLPRIGARPSISRISSCGAECAQRFSLAH